MIRFETVDAASAELLADLIRECFAGQAKILGLTREACPNFVAFETAESVRQRLALGFTPVLAHIGDETIGTVWYGREDNDLSRGHIKRLAVRPPFRGKDYGSQLLEYGESRLAETAAGAIELALVAQFHPLGACYERHGYRAVREETLPGFPFSVLFMEKRLPSQAGRRAGD